MLEINLQLFGGRGGSGSRGGNISTASAGGGAATDKLLSPEERRIKDAEAAFSSGKNTVRTAYVRTPEGNLKTMRQEDYNSKKSFASDLRGNGYKVVKIWNGDVKDEDADGWASINYKGYGK